MFAKLWMSASSNNNSSSSRSLRSSKEFSSIYFCADSDHLSRIVTQQICEVEVQTIILSQLEFGIRDFGRDVRRESNRQVGFDQDIAALLALLLNQDGSINVNDYGFDGKWLAITTRFHC